jgi:hypothetical protein
VRDVSVAEVGGILAGGQYLWLVPALIAQILSILARARRWVVLLGPSVRLSDAFWAQCLG